MAEASRQVEQLVSELRFECFYLICAIVDDVLHKEFGFGEVRRSRFWGHVKGRAIWNHYMERGQPLEEVKF